MNPFRRLRAENIDGQLDGKGHFAVLFVDFPQNIERPME